MNDIYGFYFGQPWWLLGLMLLAPIVWLGLRNLAALGPVRRWLAIILRSSLVIILIALLARLILTREQRSVTVITVLDRSQSIPTQLQQASFDYLDKAIENKNPRDQLAVIDVAEAANISKLPTRDGTIHQRNTTLDGGQSKLADGLQMALAISPPDTAVRIVLVSEGNETAGDLKEAARTAAANGIPVDVLPLRYQYDHEVVFKRLAAPARARSNQTISLRFILSSTSTSRGKLQLNLNDKPVDLDPTSPQIAAPIELKPGTNVQTISLPVGTRGLHEFEAVFLPDGPGQDRIDQNNRASAITNVAGPGHVLVLDTDGASAQTLITALRNSEINVQYSVASDFPDNLVKLMGTDAVILVNTDCSKFTFQQQELLCRYVNDLGGGLIMVGGPESFGAGGWIGSPVADILPVDLDPPQKQQMPKGALVLVIDRSGSMTGEKVEICKIAAAAAVRLLSRRDMVGIVLFHGVSDWLVPLGPADDKDNILQRIRNIGGGGGTVMGPAMIMARDALQGADAAVKHVILLTDGQTSDRDICAGLGQSMDDSEITVSTVAVGPSVDADLLLEIAQATQGRFYRVTDPMNIPEIFVKEAQVVRRSMIVEQTFTPQIVSGFSEIIKGLSSQLPALDGYVLTGPKGGLNQIVLSSDQADPIFATCQSGMGRCVAFTSSVDSRWGSSWLGWRGFERFWEQTVRWVGKPAESSDCEVFADVQGRQVTINVEAIDAEGKFMQFASIEGQIIAPDVTSETLELIQTGPGQYRGQFQAGSSGSYLVNLRYKKLAEQTRTHFTHSTVTIPFAPEFRDLSDNAPLLAEISEISGGRILPSDPNQANLFDYTGLEFPQTEMPLLRPLMFFFLALFLLDVAVRRVVLDFRAMARRMVSIIRLAKPQHKADPVLERLRLRRQKLQEQLSRGKAAAIAAKRYKGAETFDGDLPVAKVTEQTEPMSVTPSEKQTPEKIAAHEDSSHIQRLLKAKRKAAGLEQDGED
ncbi:MAG: VWA domain-containing protein [Sedimentisphaerales bacterium]|nr:VWA domain-containing protein [Sedimentisphaerales bacterium]